MLIQYYYALLVLGSPLRGASENQLVVACPIDSAI